MKRKYKAAFRHHQIAQNHFDNIHIYGLTETSGDDGVKLMVMDAKGAKINRDGFTLLREFVQETQARLIILDPLGGFVGGGLPDNTAMMILLMALKAVALEFDAAIIIAHHNNKWADPSDVKAMLGASAIVNHSRTAVMITPMSAEEAEELNILPEHAEEIFRLSSGKRNNVSKSDRNDEPWYWQVSVNLGNGAEYWPNGDNVGVVEIYDIRAMGGVKTAGGILVNDRIALRVIDAAAIAGRHLSRATNTRRSYRKAVRSALRQAGVRIGNDYTTVDKLIDSLEVRGLIYDDRLDNKTKGLILSAEGRAAVNEDAPQEEEPRHPSNSESKPEAAKERASPEAQPAKDVGVQEKPFTIKAATQPNIPRGRPSKRT
jgi:AAA domain